MLALRPVVGAGTRLAARSALVGLRANASTAAVPGDEESRRRQELVQKVLGQLEKEAAPPPPEPLQHLSSNRIFTESRIALGQQDAATILQGLKAQELASMNPAVKRIFSMETANQMDINEEKKRQAILKFQRQPGDTGSPEVQIAILTTRVTYLTEHMKRNRNDLHTRRGLQLLVEQRRKLLKYLRRISIERYVKLVQALDLRVASDVGKDNPKARATIRRHLSSKAAQKD